MQDLNKMTVSQLREMAMTLGVPDYAKLKKAEAYAAVMNILNPGNAAPEKAAQPKADENATEKAPQPKAAENAPEKAAQDEGSAGITVKTPQVRPARKPGSPPKGKPGDTVTDAAPKQAEGKVPEEPESSMITKPMATKPAEPEKSADSMAPESAENPIDSDDRAAQKEPEKHDKQKAEAPAGPGMEQPGRQKPVKKQPPAAAQAPAGKQPPAAAQAPAGKQPPAGRQKTSLKAAVASHKEANRQKNRQQAEQAARRKQDKGHSGNKAVVPLDDELTLEYQDEEYLTVTPASAIDEDDYGPDSHEAAVEAERAAREAARLEAEVRRAMAKAEAAQYGIELPVGVDDFRALSSGEQAGGILELMPEGYGFLRVDGYLPGEKDVYVSPSLIRRWQIRTGDFIEGYTKVRTGTEKYVALLYPTAINGQEPEAASAPRKKFESLTPIFPNEMIKLERGTEPRSMRIMDLFSPVGKGQRGMIVSPPKAGKTTLIKDVAISVKQNHPEIRIIILLIDERPEEVTDIKESLMGPNVEVAYSTFDEMPEHHKKVAEMVLNRAKRLVEQGEDVMILLDSITRLSRAYNLLVTPSGRTLSGGLDPAALYMPKKFFGAARNMREGGSLTILATALVDTGSRMDDVIFEEFKGTGNMEIVLDRKMSEKRVFPAIDILKSGTRMDNLLIPADALETINSVRRVSASMKPEDATEKIIDLVTHTRTNSAFIDFAGKKILQ